MSTSPKSSNKSAGGYWMLIGLVVLLMAPIAVDRVLHSADAHAEATAVKN